MNYLDSNLYRYSMANCLFNAAYHKILTECHCLPDLHDHDTSKNVQQNASNSFHDNLTPCIDGSLLCKNQILDKIGDHNTVPETGEVCMPACEDQVHQVEVTSSSFPNRATFPRREEQCLLILKLQSVCRTNKSVFISTIYPYLCSNVSLQYDRCSQGSVDPYKKSGLEPRAQALLEHMLFKYAKENLVLVNIYIKVKFT